MIALKTVDLRNDFKKVSDLINSGEKVLISRPRNENLIVLSEQEYNELEKIKKNARYSEIIEESALQVAEGRTITLSLDELEALVEMSKDEMQAFIAYKRKGSTIEAPKRKLGFLSGPPLPDSFFDPLPEEDLQAWGL